MYNLRKQMWRRVVVATGAKLSLRACADERINARNQILSVVGAHRVDALWMCELALALDTLAEAARVLATHL